MDNNSSVLPSEHSHKPSTGKEETSVHSQREENNADSLLEETIHKDNEFGNEAETERDLNLEVHIGNTPPIREDESQFSNQEVHLPERQQFQSN